jgi:hypothetical protein
MFIRLCLLSVLTIGAAKVPAYGDDGRIAGSVAVSDASIVMEQVRGQKVPRGYRGSPPCGFIIPC